jgi:hypothetical protein
VEIAGGGQSPGVPQKRIRELSLLFIMHRSSSHLLFVKFVDAHKIYTSKVA